MEKNNPILNLSIEEFIAEKLKFHREQIDILLGIRDNYLVNGKTNYTAPKENLGKAITNNSFNYPSRKKMIENILNYLQNNKVGAKTIEIVKLYHLQDVENDSVIRENLVKRYSGALGELVEKKKLFKGFMEGKTGNIYTYYEELLSKNE